jgi:hypothetical protein
LIFNRADSQISRSLTGASVPSLQPKKGFAPSLYLACDVSPQLTSSSACSINHKVTELDRIALVALIFARWACCLARTSLATIQSQRLWIKDVQIFGVHECVSYQQPSPTSPDPYSPQQTSDSVMSHMPSMIPPRRR